jgi:ketosteroid isomerase-like protein
MSMSNLDRMKAYLQAVEAMGSFESVAQFSASDATFLEFPNRLAPQGRVRRGDELRAAWEQGRKFMKSQSYRVQRVIENGDDMAVELEWTGVLAVPVMNLPAGSEMKAFVAMFLRFRDGKIVEQRNYDCYPPFGELKS